MMPQRQKLQNFNAINFEIEHSSVIEKVITSASKTERGRSRYSVSVENLEIETIAQRAGRVILMGILRYLLIAKSGFSKIRIKQLRDCSISFCTKGQILKTNFNG